MRLLAVLAAVSLIACSARQKGPDGKPLWFVAESEHFVVRADTTEAEARKAAGELERVREALLRGSWHARTQPTAKVQVLLVDDHASLREFFDDRALAGVTTQDPFGNLLLIVPADESPSAIPVLKHELAHANAHAFLLREPRWLSEGLASYLETLRIVDGTAIVGEAHPQYVAATAHTGFYDFARVLSSGEEIYRADERDRRDFYAQAWLIVHLLANKHRPQLDAYIDRLARAEDPQTAFAAVFPGLTPQALEAEARDYVRHGEYFKLKVPLTDPPAQVQVRTLGPAGVHTARAQLWEAASRMEARPSLLAKAAAEAQDALAADAGDALAAAVWAQASNAPREQVVATARAATQAQADDARAWMFLVQALGHEPSAERDAAVERAAKLAPSDARALSELSYLQLSRGQLDVALTTALAANRAAPGQPQPLDAVASALAANGHCAEAVATERRVVEVLPDGAGPAMAAQVRARVDELGRRCHDFAQARTEAAAPVTEPRRLSCRTAGPRIAATKGLKPGSVLTVRYRVRADGSVSDAHAEGGPAPALKAIVDHVTGCRFEPARRGGTAIDSDMGETFTLAPAR